MPSVQGANWLGAELAIFGHKPAGAQQEAPDDHQHGEQGDRVTGLIQASENPSLPLQRLALRTRQNPGDWFPSGTEHLQRC